MLTLVWLTIGPGLPVGGAPQGAAQTVEPEPAEIRNLDRAIAAQRRLVSERTRSADRASALNDLANLLELGGDVEGAFEHYRAAIAEDGAWAPAHYNLALLAYTTGDRELASMHLEAAVELEPGNAWAHYQLGRLADDAGDVEAAVDHYVHALSLDARLAFTDLNPHFAANRYATEALLKADRSRVEALPPRTYSEPGRISSLLLPRMEEEAPTADDGGPAEAAEGLAPDPDSPRRASRATGRPGASAAAAGRAVRSPGSPPTDDQAVDRDVDRAAAVEIVETDRETAAAGGETAAPPPRVFTREHLRTRTLGGGKALGGAPMGGAPPPESPVGGFGGGVQFGTPVGPGGRQATSPPAETFRGGGGRFQPDVRSSAQLETTIRRRTAPAP